MIWQCEFPPAPQTIIINYLKKSASRALFYYVKVDATNDRRDEHQGYKHVHYIVYFGRLPQMCDDTKKAAACDKHFYKCIKRSDFRIKNLKGCHPQCLGLGVTMASMRGRLPSRLSRYRPAVRASRHLPPQPATAHAFYCILVLPEWKATTTPSNSLINASFSGP